MNFAPALPACLWQFVSEMTVLPHVAPLLELLECQDNNLTAGVKATITQQMLKFDAHLSEFL